MNLKTSPDDRLEQILSRTDEKHTYTSASAMLSSEQGSAEPKTKKPKDVAGENTIDDALRELSGMITVRMKQVIADVSPEEKKREIRSAQCTMVLHILFYWVVFFFLRWFIPAMSRDMDYIRPGILHLILLILFVFSSLNYFKIAAELTKYDLEMFNAVSSHSVLLRAEDRSTTHHDPSRPLNAGEICIVYPMKWWGVSLVLVYAVTNLLGLKPPI